MKTFHSAFLALLMGAAQAQEAKLPAQSLSPGYEAVAKHLELGGMFYGYADLGGNILELTRMVQEGINMVRAKGDEDIPEGLTAEGIVKALGLDCIDAVGASSRKKGDLIHNRAFISMPKGSSGVMKIFGGKPAPFLSATLVPAGSDFVVEQDVNLSGVVEIVREVLKGIDDKDARQGFDEGLKQKMVPLPFTVEDFLKKMNTKFTMFVSLDAEKKFPVPLPTPEGEDLPFMHAVLAIDNMGWLFDGLVKTLAESDEFEVQSGEGYQTIRPAKPLPPVVEGYKPLLYLDKKTNRVYLATTPEFLQSSIAGKTPISGDAEYNKAVDGLPAEGNGVQYVSPEAIKTLWRILEMGVQTQPKGEREAMLKIWKAYFPESKSGLASVHANLPNGMLFTSNTMDSHKSTIAAALIYPLALIGGVTNVKSKMKIRQGNLPKAEAEEAEEEEEPAPRPRPKVEKKVNPQEKVADNLAQIAFAAEAYFLDHPKEKTVTYAGLIKGGFLFEVAPVAGESYKEIVLKRSGGKLSVTLKSGDVISHPYTAVTD